MKVVENKQTILIIRFDRCFLDLLRTEDSKDYFSGKLDAYVETMYLQDIISKDEYHYLFNAIETARTLDLSLKMEEILNKV
jgi:hypothetical protein